MIIFTVTAVTTTTVVVDVGKIKLMQWAGHVAQTDEITNVYTISVGRPKRKKAMGKSDID
jgi:hypothetical protein